MPFLSEVRLMAFDFAPKGWALCNGQVLPIKDNTALFALLGAQFGGDGETTFALPKLPAYHGATSCIAVAGVYPKRG